MIVDLSESVTGLVGRGWMFSATPSSAVTGPFLVMDRGVFTPGIQSISGSQQATVFTPGIQDAAVFTPGAVDQEFWS